MDIRKIQEDNKPKKHKIENSDSVLLIVEPKPKELTALRKQCSSRKRGSRSLGDTVNHDRLNRLLLDKFVVGWERIDLDDKPAECNLENKIICDENWSAFSECWNSVIGGFEDDAEEEAEAEVKN